MKRPDDGSIKWRQRLWTLRDKSHFGTVIVEPGAPISVTVRAAARCLRGSQVSDEVLYRLNAVREVFLLHLDPVSIDARLSSLDH